MIENDNGYLTNIFFKHQFGNVLVGGTNGNLTTSVLKMSKYFWDIGSPELPRALEKSACLEGSDGTLYLLGGDDFFGTVSFKLGDATTNFLGSGQLHTVVGKSLMFSVAKVTLRSQMSVQPSVYPSFSQ